MFVVLIILRGGEARQFCSGYFYARALHIEQRFCTPVWMVNAPTASKVISNGKGRTVFFFCLYVIFIDMLITENKKSCEAGIRRVDHPDPLTELTNQVSQVPKFKRLAVYIKSGGISLVLFANKKVTSCWAKTLPDAINEMQIKLQISSNPII